MRVVLVVDSSVLIEHLRGRGRVTAFLEDAIQDGRVHVPALAAWELWTGASTPRQREGVYALLGALTVEPFGPAMAKLAGELHVDHRERGLERPTFDLLIASHALHHDCPLATLDRDYGSVKGLRVVEA